MMNARPARLLATAIGSLALQSATADAAALYYNLTPTNLIAMASRPGGPGVFEIETADDFVLTGSSTISSASFIGLLTGTTPVIGGVVVQVYRVFPQDSDSTRTPNVPTRTNSPSDVEFDSRNSSSGFSFATSVLNASFTAINSVQAGGIHPSPSQTTGGGGTVTGQEVQFDLDFSTPLSLPAGHYFFVPQVAVTNGGFLWLSASRPIGGAGTTPFAPDLQVWTREAFLDPDWLRVGSDIVGGSPAPTYNGAFALNGTTVPEPSTLALLGLVLAGLGIARTREAR